MADRAGERRALYEAIVTDPHANHADRLKADERLAELDVRERSTAAVAKLSPEQVLEELESLADALPAMIAVQRGVAGVEPPEPLEDVREVLALAVEVNAHLERLLAERERALQRVMAQRLLPASHEVLL